MAFAVGRPIGTNGISLVRGDGTMIVVTGENHVGKRVATLNRVWGEVLGHVCKKRDPRKL